MNHGSCTPAFVVRHQRRNRPAPRRAQRSRRRAARRRRNSHPSENGVVLLVAGPARSPAVIDRRKKKRPMADQERIPGCRQFMVFTMPHRRDPELKTPVIELDGSTNPPTPIEYEDTSVIEGVILNLARDRARAAGYNSGAKAVLDTYGLTVPDYLAKKKSKKLIDKSSEKGVASENDTQPPTA